MSFLRKMNKETGTLAMVFAIIVSAFAPAYMAMADTVTSRSIAMSSASAGAESVSYQVKFTAPNAAGAVVVDFCDSPTIGVACVAPTGFDASSATTATSGVSNVTGSTNTVTYTQTIASATPVSVDLDDIDNPTDVGAFYARIVTYDTPLHAEEYAATDLGDGVVDQGSVALSTTDTVHVGGAVLETMVFCVAKDEIAADCDLDGNSAPVVELGEATGAVTALQAGVLSTGSVYSQLTTNAVSGAVVSLKSSATGCGGLLRAGNLEACDIAPALDEGIEAGEAKFGVMLASSSDALGSQPTNVTGTLQPAGGSIYNTTDYNMNWVEGDATGVTGVYGDPFIDSNGAPVSNKNMLITFAASVNNSTPAGSYAADISLIATGKF